MGSLNFKVICAGWNCDDVLEQTLRSVEMQTYQDWEVHIVDDGSAPKQQNHIMKWCAEHNTPEKMRWGYTLHDENMGAVCSQYEGVRAMDPDDEDVIVYLDLDGDQLAHKYVFERLLDAYASPDVLVTYGDYEPVPKGHKCAVSRFPRETEHENSYRYHLLYKGTLYNHVRTMKWKVLKQIPESYYKWPDGTWLFTGGDGLVMAGALEIAGGKYKCFDEVLYLYNAAQPSPDNVRHPAENVRCSDYALAMAPLPRGF